VDLHEIAADIDADFLRLESRSVEFDFERASVSDRSRATNRSPPNQPFSEVNRLRTSFSSLRSVCSESPLKNDGRTLLTRERDLSDMICSFFGLSGGKTRFGDNARRHKGARSSD
jgi:hypothetical protein